MGPSHLNHLLTGWKANTKVLLDIHTKKKEEKELWGSYTSLQESRAAPSPWDPPGGEQWSQVSALPCWWVELHAACCPGQGLGCQWPGAQQVSMTGAVRPR